MKIIVFGATGKVGQLVIAKLLEANHQVTAFVRSASKLTPHDNLTIFSGDVHDARAVGEAVKGQDAVMSALGSWHTPDKDILSAAMRAIIPAMQAGSIRRLISLTGSGATAPGDELGLAGKLSHGLFSFIAKDIINDAEVHLTLLADSGLDWTVLRASIMRGGTNEHYTLSNKLPGAVETINRQAVAQAMVDQLDDKTHLAQAPHLHQAK